MSSNDAIRANADSPAAPVKRRRVGPAFALFLALLLIWPGETRAETPSAVQTGSPVPEATGTSQPGPRLESHRIVSPHFQAPKPLRVYLPPGFEASPETNYPVLYFLHGLGNSPDDFESRGAAALTDRLIREGRVPPVIIALPSGAISYYVNRKGGGAPYEDHVRLEAPAYVEEHYPVRTGRAGRGISGISMGGFGALKIAMRYPEEFGSASAHTPFLMKEAPRGEGTDRTSRLFMRVMKTLFGDPIDEAMWRANNPFALAKEGGGAFPPLMFTAASRDRYDLQIPARQFHRELRAIEIPHTYVPFDGVHGWKSLESHWEDMLRFHAEVWAASARPIAD